jgi:hypothetical protein
VSSGSDEQVGSSSQSTVTQTNVDEDEMEDVVDGEETVEDEEEEESDVVRELLSKHSVWLGM